MTEISSLNPCRSIWKKSSRYRGGILKSKEVSYTQQDYLQIVEGLPTGQITQYAICENTKGKMGEM